ncbi:hypothetical protein F886_00062 [Acinetobacter sp. NIPH 542]|uniref:hypothetical protein n=1 Tax=Acinetobacter sp. NIPH 542 TaxID=1217688 RepID=UPI0002D12C8F|nr:hypothetical protein [Acinetobacter sp. NIPH 542]ENX48261.1 hypothetical protein F886_00062 [Acinetobacter sp. NIPH 542]
MVSRFTIKNHCDISPVTNFLNVNHAQAAAEGKPLVVIIKPDDRNRSKAQNRLYWDWLTEWAKFQGSNKDYEHLFFKYTLLSRIFYRDGVGDYRKTFDTVRALKAEKHPLYNQVRDSVTTLTSTRDASTKQMSEYLNDIHAFCLKQGCYLETPDDLKYALE